MSSTLAMISIAANVVTALSVVFGLGLAVWKGGRVVGEIMARLEGVERAVEKQNGEDAKLWAQKQDKAYCERQQDQITQSLKRLEDHLIHSP